MKFTVSLSVLPLLLLSSPIPDPNPGTVANVAIATGIVGGTGYLLYRGARHNREKELGRHTLLDQQNELMTNSALINNELQNQDAQIAAATRIERVAFPLPGESPPVVNPVL